MKNKKLIIICSSIFLFLFFAVFSVPYILSTKSGMNFIKNKKNFEATKLNFSWFGPQKMEDIKITSDKMDFSAKYFESNSNFISFLKTKPQNFLSVKAKTNLIDADIKIKKNLPKNVSTIQISLTGYIENKGKNKLANLQIQGKSKVNHQIGFFNIQTSFDKDKYNGNITLKNFPTVLADFFLLKDNKSIISDLLGSKIDTDSKFHLVDSIGQAHIDLTSNNMQLKTSLQYSKNCISLSSPLTTKILSKIPNSEISFKTPIEITVDQGEILFPLDLKEIQVGKATVNLGQIKLKNENALNLILSTIKHRLDNNEKYANVWCAPVNIKINNGILYVSRLDVLLGESLHACSWGTIDLTTQKINITLGLPAKTLSKKFGLKNIPENYTLHIPIKGTLGNLKIDKKLVAKQITDLPSIQGKKHKKSFLNQFFEIFKNTNKEETPSSEFPLPWEKSR